MHGFNKCEFLNDLFGINLPNDIQAYWDKYEHKSLENRFFFLNILERLYRLH